MCSIGISRGKSTLVLSKSRVKVVFFSLAGCLMKLTTTQEVNYSRNSTSKWYCRFHSLLCQGRAEFRKIPYFPVSLALLALGPSNTIFKPSPLPILRDIVFVYYLLCCGCLIYQIKSSKLPLLCLLSLNKPALSCFLSCKLFLSCRNSSYQMYFVFLPVNYI